LKNDGGYVLGLLKGPEGREMLRLERKVFAIQEQYQRVQREVSLEISESKDSIRTILRPIIEHHHPQYRKYIQQKCNEMDFDLSKEKKTQTHPQLS